MWFHGHLVFHGYYNFLFKIATKAHFIYHVRTIKSHFSTETVTSRTQPIKFSILSQNCIPQSLKDFIIVNSYQLDHISLILPSPSYSCCTGQLAVFKHLHLVSKINNSSDGFVDICVEYKDLRMDEIENRG